MNLCQELNMLGSEKNNRDMYVVASRGPRSHPAGRAPRAHSSSAVGGTSGAASRYEFPDTLPLSRMLEPGAA